MNINNLFLDTVIPHINILYLNSEIHLHYNKPNCFLIFIQVFKSNSLPTSFNMIYLVAIYKNYLKELFKCLK